MSKLQNDYTTPEQSKRLLELGVPADSANLFYSKFECKTFENRPTLCYDKKYSDIVPHGYEKDYLPCWSEGRLMRIFHICVSHTSMYGWNYHEDVDGNYIDYIIQEYIDALKWGELDFSKLEE